MLLLPWDDRLSGGNPFVCRYAVGVGHMRCIIDDKCYPLPGIFATPGVYYDNFAFREMRGEMH